MRCAYDWSQYWKENRRNCFAVPTYKCFVASILTVEEVSFQPHVLFIMTGFLNVGRKKPLIIISGNYKSYSQGSNLQAAEDAGEESGLWLQGTQTREEGCIAYQWCRVSSWGFFLSSPLSFSGNIMLVTWCGWSMSCVVSWDISSIFSPGLVVW